MEVRKWWGIRHLRYWWTLNRVLDHVEKSAHFGLGFWMNPADRKALDDIWEGKR